MEENYYLQQLNELKNEVLTEIVDVLGTDGKHDFREHLVIHYVYGEVATHELIKGVKANGNIPEFYILNEIGDEETITLEKLNDYDIISLINILRTLKKELREDKLAILRELVRNYNSLNFDGGFTFSVDERDETSIGGGGIVDDCHLTGLRLCVDGTLVIHNTFEGTPFINDEDSILYEDIDRMISYVKSQTTRKFVIRVSGSFSRTFDVNASSYEEALEIAKKDWKVNPLYSDDSNGEDWEDYTSLCW